MQLVWSDILKENEWILDIIEVYFIAMQSQNIGKASTKFFEVAEELHNIVLTNKTYQATRFVRALLRGLTAALRNLPTLHAVVYREFTDHAVACSNTRALELQNAIDNLQNAKNLFFTIGLVQLLEIYCVVSLEVQSSSHFPIQAWAKIDKAKAELATLGENWVYSTEQQKMSGIGTPNLIIDSIIEDPMHIYTPFVPLGTIKKNKDRVDIDFEQLLADKDMATIFEEENQRVYQLAGKFQNLQNYNQYSMY